MVKRVGGVVAIDAHLLVISVNLGTRVNGNDTHYDIQGVLFINHSR